MKRLSQKEIARKLNIDETFLSKILNGTRPFPIERAREAEKLHGINKSVLVFGNPEEIREELEKVFGNKAKAA